MLKIFSRRNRRQSKGVRMKADFHKTYVEHFPRLPAEACSELGYMSEPRKQVFWISRMLEVTRRWFTSG
jgi:hypothetical protein